MTMYNNIRKNVNWGDCIRATLDYNGCRLASVNGNDFSSLEAVKVKLLEMAGCYAGMAVITVRNCSQGWRDVTAIATMRRPVSMPQSNHAVTPHKGSQYIIP